MSASKHTPGALHACSSCEWVWVATLEVVLQFRCWLAELMLSGVQ